MSSPARASWPKVVSSRPSTGVALAWTEGVIAAIVVILFSDAVIGPVFDPNQTGGDQVGWLRLIWIPAYAAIVVLSLRRYRRLGRFWAPGLLLLAMVAWAAISVLWAEEPAITLRRSIALAFTTLFGFYLASARDGRGLAELLAATFGVLAAASLVVCLADPSFGVHQHVNAGDWKGLWYEKNQMGSLMTQGVLAATVAATLSARRRRLWIATAALCAFMVVMSRSATDLFMLAAVLLGLAVLHAARRGPVFAVIGAWICVTLAGLLAAAAALWPDHFYRAIGKDPTLTGRTDIWVIVGHWIAKAPWLGYGYGGFWARNSPPAQYIRDELGWLVPNAHNGWLDLLLQLGIVGAIVAAVVFALAVAAALFRGSRLKDGYWSVMFLITFAFATVSESVILQENNLAWVLCAAAMARLLGPAPAAPARPQLRLVA